MRERGIIDGTCGPCLLFALTAALFIIGINAPLLEPQEARYAEIAREMRQDGDWVVPHLMGQPYLDKPPLLYWLIAASNTIFGESDAAARFVSALAAILTVLIVYLWGRSIVGRREALAGAAMLALGGRFVYLDRLLTFDSLLTLWTTAALAAAHLAMNGKRFWWVLSAVAAGLGVLTKGPVALALVVPPIIIWQISGSGTRRSSDLPKSGSLGDFRYSHAEFTPNWKEWALWGAIALLPALPWFVSVELRHPGFLTEFLWRHHIERYVMPFDHEKPFWFYLPDALLGLFPWTLLLPGAAVWCWKANAELRAQSARLFIIAAIWCVVFFSFAGCKRPTYLLPAFGPLALFLGTYFVGRVGYARIWRACFAGTAVMLLGAAAIAWPAYARMFSLQPLCTPLLNEHVVCSPRLWDSVPYYLRRNDVQIWPPERLAELSPGTVVFVPEKNGVPSGVVTELLGRHDGLATYRINGHQAPFADRAASPISPKPN